MLTEAQIQRYEDDGFLVLPGFSSQEEVAALLASGHELLNENFTSDSYSVFSTRNQEKKTDFYFLDSANNVSFFYEEKASKSEDSKSAAINKIGHGTSLHPHRLFTNFIDRGDLEQASFFLVYFFLTIPLVIMIFQKINAN